MHKMREKLLMMACIVMLLFTALLATSAKADDQSLTMSVSYTDSELDNLLASIALYPDPLLAQLLPAATYPAELTEAYDWLNTGGNQTDIDNFNWDESVKAIAHYPDVVRMMAENMDWTANVGDAFLNQPEDVMSSIQRLRQEARDMNNLNSNDKQDVYDDGGNIEILPAQPQYVYPPVYDPLVVYVQRQSPGGPPFVLFGPRLILGGWLAMDFDWNQRHVIYHGWNRSGWVNSAKPYIRLTDVYINRSRPLISQAWRHDASHGNPAQYLASRPSGPDASRYARIGEVRGSQVAQPTRTKIIFGSKGEMQSYSYRGKESRGLIIQQHPEQSISHNVMPRATLAPGASERRPIPTPTVNLSQRESIPSSSTSDQRIAPSNTLSQNRTMPNRRADSMTQSNSESVGTQHASTARPSVAFGGYRGADEAKMLSQRGKASRQNYASAPNPTSSVPVQHSVASPSNVGHGEKQHR